MENFTYIHKTKLQISFTKLDFVNPKIADPIYKAGDK